MGKIRARLAWVRFKKGNGLNTKPNYKKAAVIISAALILSALFSLLYLLLPSWSSAAGCGGYTAEIYQDGRLLYSIPLNNISESRTFVIESTESGRNEIELRPGSIGIISANCPDKLCVHQGFITDARLPVTCLPNRLVILLRPAQNAESHNSITPDIITY